MGLLSYIKGQRRGPEAHRIEREAMQDAFLADALEGYDACADSGAADRLARLQQEVARRTARRNRLPLYRAVAAVLLLCLSVSAYLFIRYDSPREELAVLDSSVKPPNIEKSVSSGLPVVESPVSPEPEPALSNLSVQQVAEKPETASRKRVADLSSEEEMVSRPEAVADVADGCDRPEVIAIEDVQMEAVARPQAAESAEVTSDEAFARHATVKKQQKLVASAAAAPVSVVPAPVGGYDACYDYLRKNITLPTDTADTVSPRSVVLRFAVDKKGRPGGFTVVKSFSPETAQEIIRLLQSGPDWTPSGLVPAFTVTF